MNGGRWKGTRWKGTRWMGTRWMGTRWMGTRLMGTEQGECCAADRPARGGGGDGCLHEIHVMVRE